MASLAASIEYQMPRLAETRQPLAVGIWISAQLLSTVAVALRMWAKRSIKARVSYDDYAIIVALVLSFAFIGPFMIGWPHPRHVPKLVCSPCRSHQGRTRKARPGRQPAQCRSMLPGTSAQPCKSSKQDLTRALQMQYIMEIIYTLIMPATKTSILLFYYRIFPSQRVRLQIWALGIFCMLTWVPLFFVAIFPCDPIRAFYDKSVDGKCINMYTTIMAQGVLTLVTDILILILPMPLVWNLRVTTRQKVGVSVVFLLGSL